MKIRRSARTILTTLLLISLFTSLTVWHNKAPHSLSQQAQQSLSQELGQINHGLTIFLEPIAKQDDVTSFYAMGTSVLPAWPTSVFRASYSDPLARLNQTPSIKTLIRYRSVEDFLVILSQVEQQVPGTLRSLDFQNYKAILEPSVIISFRLLFSLLVGVCGLIAIRLYNR